MDKTGAHPAKVASITTSSTQQQTLLAGLDSMTAQLFQQHQQRHLYHERLMLATSGFQPFCHDPGIDNTMVLALQGRSHLVQDYSNPMMTTASSNTGSHGIMFPGYTSNQLQCCTPPFVVPFMPYQHFATGENFAGGGGTARGDRGVAHEIQYHRRLQAMMQQDILDLKRLLGKMDVSLQAHDNDQPQPVLLVHPCVPISHEKEKTRTELKSAALTLRSMSTQDNDTDGEEAVVIEDNTHQDEPTMASTHPPLKVRPRAALTSQPKKKREWEKGTQAVNSKKMKHCSLKLYGVAGGSENNQPSP